MDQTSNQETVNPSASSGQAVEQQSSVSQQQIANSQMPEINHWHMSKKTVALIITLAGFAIFFIFLAILPPRPTGKLSTPTPTPTPFAQSMLTLQLAQPSSSLSANTRQITAMVETGANVVTGVQFELGFDPKVITNITLTPGAFFSQPTVLFKDVDYTTGRISYALGISPNTQGLQGKGIVATISYQINPTATASSTTVSFLPKTLVTAEGVTMSVLKSSSNITIPLLTSSPSATGQQ